MTLTIQLQAEQEALLTAKAKAHGVSAEQYAEQILTRELTPELTRPISVRVREIWSGMPDEVREKLPADGATQADHYIYGVPKRTRGNGFR